MNKSVCKNCIPKNVLNGIKFIIKESQGSRFFQAELPEYHLNRRNVEDEPNVLRFS